MATFASGATALLDASRYNESDAADTRYTFGTVRVDGGVIIGMTSRDPSIGFTGGFTWVFRGFTVP